MRQPKVSGYDRKYDKHFAEGGLEAVEWSPGTGTRYVLIAQPVGGAAIAGLIGCSPEAVLANVLTRHGWVMLPLLPDACHHLRYVGEKLRERGISSDEEILAITALLNLALGDERYGVELFADLEQQYVRSAS